MTLPRLCRRETFSNPKGSICERILVNASSKEIINALRYPLFCSDLQFLKYSIK
jgi:hypothetical protein